MNLYVYYDVPRDRTAQMREVIRSMQESLGAECGHRGRLLRRVEPADQRETWMEIYEGVAADFETRLAAAFERTGLQAAVAGPRHVERFEDLD